MLIKEVLRVIHRLERPTSEQRKHEASPGL